MIETLPVLLLAVFVLLIFWIAGRFGIWMARKHFKEAVGETTYAVVMERRGIVPRFWFDEKLPRL